ncbi:MAG TPA: acyl-CoA synthetase [Amycolatopsis sp.]|nr:acyl-CoA synthetase [Amycolatopsis sp.]
MATVVSGSRRVPVELLKDRVARAASGFAALGVGPGSGVAFCLRNDVEFYEVSLGAGALGAYAIPLNWHMSADEVRYILEDSGASVLVIHADLFDRMKAGVPDSVEVLVVPTSPDLLAAYDLDRAVGEVPEGQANWTTWLDGFGPRTAASAEMPMAVLYTSGTTGRPKGVRRRAFTPQEQAIFGDMVAIDYGLRIFDAPGKITTAVVGPLYHGAPNGHAVFSLRAGASVVIMPRFDAEKLLQLIERERITNLNMVPIMFSRLLKLPDSVRQKYDLSSLRFVGHAAAPCPPDVKRAMIDWWGPVIHEYYGTTETGNVTFCTSEEWLSHPGTVGKAIKGAEVRILDPSGEPLGPGEVGEVAIRMHGIGDFTYHNDEAKRESVARGRLVAPGDVGYLDEDGFLYISDRLIDMIISGGVNIYPAEIESVLADMPGVADCAVFGIPSEEYGESVCAVVQPVSGATLTAEEVQAYVHQRVAGYKVPRRVEFSDALPREDSGKIFKRRLRAPYWENAGRSI